MNGRPIEPATPSGPLVRNALALSHEYARRIVRPGDLVVDATAGNGHDTAFLAELVGPSGLVLAFDVQEAAVRNTRARLEAAGLADRCRVYEEGHENLGRRLDGLSAEEARPLALVLFNLGWLPGGDHRVGTRAATTVAAIGQATERVRPGGIVTVGVYYGRESGFEERDAVLALAAAADVHAFAVQRIEMANARDCAPIFLCFEKLVPGARRPPP